jgi:glutaminyl-tRNA synthetase
VRFRYSYFITCNDVVKKDDEIVELHCTYDPATRGGYAPDGRKVKSTIHWVSADHAVDAEIHLYDRLFTIPDPSGQKDKDYREFLNARSLEILKKCKIEPLVQQLKPFDRFQFERLGYFCIDKDSTDKKMLINRTVTLRDTWAKIQAQQSKQS